MRRLTVALSALVLIGCGSAAVVSNAPAYKTGISDQGPLTFSNPLYHALNFSVARYITPYDVMTDPAEKARLDAWMTAARADHQRILVSFEHSRKSTAAARKLPSVSAYTKAIKAFKAAYGSKVESVSPWNEVNRCPIAGTLEGQPTCHNPKRTAEYYNAAAKVFRGKKIVALDILDGPDKKARATIQFIKTFKRYAKPAPKIWGLHNYSDTNRFQNGARTKAILKATGSGEMWLTETGGLVALGTSFAYDEQRAKRALGCMFTLAKSNKRITRLYIYQFYGAPKGARFDAGLVDQSGAVKRPGYATALHRTAGSCSK